MGVGLPSVVAARDLYEVSYSGASEEVSRHLEEGVSLRESKWPCKESFVCAGIAVYVR